MRDVPGSEGGEGRDGGTGVPDDEQAVSAMRRRSDAGRGLHRCAASCKPTFLGLTLQTSYSTF